MSTKMIKIDAEELRSWMNKQGKTYGELSAEIGKSGSYLSRKCSTTHEMPELVYKLMIKTFKLPEGSFIPKPEPPKVKEEQLSIESMSEKPREGYWTDLKVFPDKVKFTIYFRANGTDIEVTKAFSKIKDNSELAIVQAISYAAHMCYKFAEQNRLGK